MTINSCCKPVGISLRNKSPIGILPSSGAARILSHRSSTVKTVAPPWASCRTACKNALDLRESSVSVSSVLGWILLPRLSGASPRALLDDLSLGVDGREGQCGTKICSFRIRFQLVTVVIRLKDLPGQHHLNFPLAQPVRVLPIPAHTVE